MGIYNQILGSSNDDVIDLTRGSQDPLICLTYDESVGYLHLLSIGNIIYVCKLNGRKSVLRFCEYCVHYVKRNLHNSFYDESGGKDI